MKCQNFCYIIELFFVIRFSIQFMKLNDNRLTQAYLFLRRLVLSNDSDSRTRWEEWFDTGQWRFFSSFYQWRFFKILERSFFFTQWVQRNNKPTFAPNNSWRRTKNDVFFDLLSIFDWWFNIFGTIVYSLLELEIYV